MNKEELIEIIKADQINAEQLRQLDRLIDDYPWFGLPRFLRLKAMHQAGEEADPAEVSRAVVFSSDRGYLYRWIRGEAGYLQAVSGETDSELEFIDDEDAMDDGFGTEDDANERALPEKEETEMEELEMEESETIPVIDPMDDDEGLDDDEGIAADSEEQMVTGEGGEGEGVEVSEAGAGTSGEVADDRVSDDQVSGEQVSGDQDAGDEGVEHAAAKGDVEKAPGRRSTAERYQEGSRKSTSGAANHSTSLIEQFLNSEPGVIKADKKTSLEGDVSVGSVKEDDSYITDTLAKIYVKQGLHAKAIYAYERLSLKYPEKSAYFAAQIEKIKNISII